jgi:hypothetical protein
MYSTKQGQQGTQYSYKVTSWCIRLCIVPQRGKKCFLFIFDVHISLSKINKYWLFCHESTSMRSSYCCATYVVANSIKPTQVFTYSGRYLPNFHKVPNTKFSRNFCIVSRADARGQLNRATWPRQKSLFLFYAKAPKKKPDYLSQHNRLATGWTSEKTWFISK